MTKPDLTPEEVLRVTIASIYDGIDQQKLAFLMNTNQGRISEAVQAMRWAAENHRQIYRVLVGQAKIVDQGDDE